MMKNMEYSYRTTGISFSALLKGLFFFSVFFCIPGDLITTISYQKLATAGKFSTSEAQQLSKGRIITSTAPITGIVLPMLTVWIFIPTVPRDVFAIIYDVKNDKNHYKGMIKSDIIRKIDASNRDVHFVHTMPWPIPDEDYILRQTIDIRNGRYRTSWIMLSGNRIKNSTGYWQFERFATGTLMTIESSVELSPAISRMPFVKNICIAMAKDSAEKIRARVQNIIVCRTIIFPKSVFSAAFCCRKFYRFFADHEG